MIHSQLKKSSKSAIIRVGLIFKSIRIATLLKERNDIMIDTKNFILVDDFGFVHKPDAYDTLRAFYRDLPGITTYYDNGRWYIVQSKALMEAAKTLR